MISAVIFDMDGVLVDSERFYFERRMAFFKAQGIKPGTTNQQDYLGQSNAEIWKLLVPDERERAQIKSVFNQYVITHQINFQQYLNKGVVKFLSELKEKNFKVAIASAGDPAEIKRMLTECGLTQSFDLVVSGEEMAHNKPDPEIYETVVQRLQQAKSDCLVIEDSPIGISAAKAAGLTVCALKITNVDQRASDKVFSDLESLSQWFWQREKIDTD